MDSTKIETRRRAGRAKIGSEIAYLNFDSGNGAIVVDVSSEGLGFQAADRVEPNSPLSFRLCTSELPNIDLAGEVAWLDETRKRGGLRFRVPAKSRPALDKWLRKHFHAIAEADQAPEQVEDPSPFAAPVEEVPATPSAANAQPNPKPFAPASGFSARPPIGKPFVGNQAGRGPIFVSEWEYPPEESHRSRNVLVVCVILVLGLAIAGTYYFGGRRQVGAVLIRLGQSLTGASPQAPLRTLNATNANALPPAQPNAEAQPNPQSQQPVASSPPAVPQTSAPPSASARVVAPTAPSSPANRLDAASTNSNPTPAANSTAPQAQPSNTAAASTAAAPNSASNAAKSAENAPPQVFPQPKASAAQAPPSAPAADAAPSDYGQPEVAQARKLLQDSNPADSSVAADLLWSAVSKGNTQAEMMLADLYLEGRGSVHQNCRQAEALLTAAQSANVPGAEQKIQELQTYGCR